MRTYITSHYNCNFLFPFYDFPWRLFFLSLFLFFYSSSFLLLPFALEFIFCFLTFISSSFLPHAAFHNLYFIRACGGFKDYSVFFVVVVVFCSFKYQNKWESKHQVGKWIENLVESIILCMKELLSKYNVYCWIYKHKINT